MSRFQVTVSFIRVCLLLISTGEVYTQTIPTTWQTSPLTSTSYEGQDSPYVSFSGANGLRLSIILPSTASTVSFDYSLMFWFRLNSPIVLGQQQTLFQIPQGPTCFLSSTQISCNTGQTIEINTIPNLQQWIHLTYTTSRANASSSLLLNYPLASSQMSGTFVSLTSISVFLGIGSSFTNGLRGDVRDYYMSVGRVSQQVVQLIYHMKKVFEMSCMAYYQFDETIGYYRDTYRNQIAAPIAQTGQNLPVFSSERTTYSQCCPYDDNILDSLPTFQPSYSQQSVSIPNFKGLQTGFGYTFNMWVKNGGGQGFSTTATDGIVNSSFFSLKGVFTFWFDSPTSFKVYIDATQNINKFSSPSVFLPLNEWVNIQMTISQQNGLTVLLFNSNGAQIQSMSVSNVLGTQTPVNQVTLLGNFDGAVKSFLLWEQSFPLPMSNPATQSNLKLSFDFSSTKFLSNQWQSSPLTGSVIGGVSGQGFWFSQMQVPNFQSINFINPSRLGSLSANQTLWDGLGCTQRLKYNNYYGEMRQSLLMKLTGSLTAELWFQFKKDQQFNTSRINLIQLSASTEESLTIFIEGGNLKCAPFGLNDTSSIMVFTGIQALTNEVWQHVSCGFTQGAQVFGQYLSYNTKTQTTLNSIFPVSFGKSIATSSPQELIQSQVKTTSVLVGSQLVGIAFREVRVWSELRSAEQIFSYRFRQVEPTSTNLQLNYQLTNGNLTIKNEALSGGVARSSEITVNPVTKNQTTLVICSADLYFDFRIPGCVAMPFDLLPITQVAQLSLQNGFQQVFTNQFLKSSILLPSQTPSTNQYWSLSDKPIDTSYVSLQRTQQNLVLNPITLGDGYKYNLTSVISNNKNTFWLNNTQTFYPKRCYYLADQLSKTPLNKVNVWTNSTSNTCFNMAVFGVDGCYQNHFRILQNHVAVSSSPNVPILQSSAKLTINRVSGQVQVCFDRSVVQQLPLNQPINIIFSAFWATDQEQNVATESYSTAIYEVKLLSPANITVSIQGNFVNNQDTVLLDASSSTIQGQNSSGLVFNWVCPKVLQSACDVFRRSPVIEFTNNMMMSLQASKSQDYTISVQVWSLGFGMDVQLEEFVFSKSVVFNWSKLVAPRAKIIIGQLLGQSQPSIVATQDSRATVQVDNYRIADPNLSIAWSISPSNSVVSSMVYNSSDGSTIYFKQGALQTNTQYNLTVIVTIKGGQSGINVIQVRTGVPPTMGQFTVAPTQGIMFATNFNFSFSNWMSTKSLKATLWGIIQTQPLELVQITQSLVPISQTGSFQMTSILPKIIGLQLEVYNSMGERVVQTLNLTSGRPAQTKLSWSTITKGLILSNQTSDVQKYFFLSSIARDCRSDFLNDQTDATDCIDSSNSILSWATPGLQSIQSNDDSLYATGVLSASASILAQVTLNTQTLDSNSSIRAFNMVQILSSKTIPLIICLADKNFKTNFAMAISNLVQYASQQITPTNMGRRLQQDPQSMLNGLIVQKNFLLDKMCQQSDQNSINVTGMFLSIYQFSVTDSIQDLIVYDQQSANQSLQIPIRSVLAAALDNDPLTTQVCLQVSSMALNPVPRYLFSNQTIFNSSFIQVSTLDDQGNRLLNTKGVQTTDHAPFQLSQNFDFTQKLFIKGQTTCLAYNSNNLPTRWNSSICTAYYTATQIVCSCNTINNYYFAIGNDYTLEDKTSFWDFTYQWCWQFLIILVALILLGIVLPCSAIQLDKKDYHAIEQDQFKVSEEVLEFLCRNRTYSCQQELYYKLKDIEMIQRWQTVTFWNAYSLIRLNTHPIWSFLWKFDYSVKRLMRAGILMNHISVITLIIFTIYSKGRHTLSPASPYVITVLVGLLCLTTPERLMNCLKISMIQVPKKSELNSAPSSTSQEVVLKDNSWLCKVFFFLFSTLVQILTVVICACFTWGAENRQVSFRLPRDDGRVVIIVWFSTLVWGYIILQELRIFTLTLTSRYLSTRMFLEGDQKVKGSFYRTVLQKLTSKIAVDLCLDAMFVIKHKNEDIRQLAKQESFSTGFNKGSDEKTKGVGDSSWIGNQTSVVQETTDRKYVPQQKQDEVSFNDEEHYQDDDFDVDQDLPSRTEEDVYSITNCLKCLSKIYCSAHPLSDNDRVMDLPPSSRSKLHAFYPPTNNPTPRTQVNNSSTAQKNKHNNYKVDSVDFSAQRKHNDIDSRYGTHDNQLIGETELENYTEQDLEIVRTDREAKKQKKDKKSKKEKKHKKDKKSKREPEEEIVEEY